MHPSRLRGRAPELSEYRAYRHGDDPRDLDWKLLARSDRPFVRLAEDRAVHETRFVVDGSASMAFPERTLAKWECASALTVALSSIAQRAGDPVAVVVPGAPGASLAPTTRRDTPMMIAAALGGVAPSGSAPLAPAVTRVAAASRLVLVTDLLGDEADLRAAAAAHFAGGGEVVLLHVLSRSELALDRDLVLVRDPEVPGAPRPVDAASGAAYTRALQAWRRACRDAWVAQGAVWMDVVAEADAEHAVRAVVEAAQAARVV